MNKRKPSARSLKISKRASKAGRSGKSSNRPAKRNLGDEIIRGFEEGIAWARGELKARVRIVESPVPETVDVRAVREKSGLSQPEFAARYGFSVRTLQEWEQGRARPDGAVRAYLVVIDRNPDAVRQALAG